MLLAATNSREMYGKCDSCNRITPTEKRVYASILIGAGAFYLFGAALTIGGIAYFASRSVANAPTSEKTPLYSGASIPEQVVTIGAAAVPGAFMRYVSSLSPGELTLDAEIDAAFESGNMRSGAMIRFTDEAGPLTGSGPKQGNGDIWYHDNVRVPGAGPNGEAVDVRTHAPNPNAPAGSYSRSNYTTQINTKASVPQYRLPDGTWKTLNNMTNAEKAAAHFPAGN